MIREGTQADIIKTSRLWVQMVNEMKPEYKPNMDWWRKIASANLRFGSYEFVVNDDGGKITGFLDWFIFPEPSTGKYHAIGQHFYIVPERRDSGIAPLMYNMALEIAKKKGAEVIELFCFEEERPLWEKKGFKTVRYLLRQEV